MTTSSRLVENVRAIDKSIVFQSEPTRRIFSGIRLPWGRRNIQRKNSPQFERLFRAKCQQMISDPMYEEIRKMRVPEMRKEMDSLGVMYHDLLEKPEYFERLYLARKGTLSDEFKKNISNQSTQQSPEVDSMAQAPQTESQTSEARQEQVRTSVDSPEPMEVSKEERIKVREEVKAMKIKEIKAELDERGVSYIGLLERPEYVDLLVTARVENINNQGASSSSGSAGNAETVHVIDAEIVSDKEFEREQENSQQKDNDRTSGNPFGGGNPFSGFGGGGNPFGGSGMSGGMGGMPGGMGGMPGGMGGMPGGMGGMPGGMPGGMGGMPGGMGGTSGGMGGMGGLDVQDILSKVMSNPKALAAFQKAAQNPKIMQAIQELQSGGPAAAQKYANDPEIKEIMDTLKDIILK
eukprot:CAMPEP_0167756562 /NCGR_PEP_ID=MMETSP0110_2-20121227/9454_1 /TAXON_ID=629695 /ORGANISM="Gymnochlora sp., Strain CCMP2014" /LENGTH=406 /DNA_ID=CAMNT_0007642685 /DNA_START=107 /DNA_END=1327 /DNA_ORIENTATION=-